MLKLKGVDTWFLKSQHKEADCLKNSVQNMKESTLAAERSTHATVTIVFLNSSSKSLKYLLGDSPKSYRESKYEGKSAQHSQLHENKEVAKEFIAFLWTK